MKVTLNRAAPGYSISGDIRMLGLPLLEVEGSTGQTWESLGALLLYCLEQGVTAEVTPCDWSGTNFYFGNGGYRYRPREAFAMPRRMEPR